MKLKRNISEEKEEDPKESGYSYKVIWRSWKLRNKGQKQRTGKSRIVN